MPALRQLERTHPGHRHLAAPLQPPPPPRRHQRRHPSRSPEQPPWKRQLAGRCHRVRFCLRRSSQPTIGLRPPGRNCGGGHRDDRGFALSGRSHCCAAGILKVPAMPNAGTTVRLPALASEGMHVRQKMSATCGRWLGPEPPCSVQHPAIEQRKLSGSAAKRREALGERPVLWRLAVLCDVEYRPDLSFRSCRR